MRKITIQLLMLFTMILVNLSCSKDKDKQNEPKIEIDEKNLTMPALIMQAANFFLPKTGT